MKTGKCNPQIYCDFLLDVPCQTLILLLFKEAILLNFNLHPPTLSSTSPGHTYGSPTPIALLLGCHPFTHFCFVDPHAHNLTTFLHVPLRGTPPL